MIVKGHKSKSGLIVSVCDEDILGKKYSENGLLLDLTSDFYKGKKMSRDDAEKNCKKAYIINAVGEKSVELVKKMGIIRQDNIRRIKKIPFVQCLVLNNEI